MISFLLNPRHTSFKNREKMTLLFPRGSLWSQVLWAENFRHSFYKCKSVINGSLELLAPPAHSKVFLTHQRDVCGSSGVKVLCMNIACSLISQDPKSI